MGMPTWDNIKEFNKSGIQGIEIVYSTPFYNAKIDKVSLGISNYFKEVMFAARWYYSGVMSNLEICKTVITRYKDDFASNITSKLNKVFTDYDSTARSKQNMTLDYFRKQKLYFLKWQDGVLKAV